MSLVSDLQPHALSDFDESLHLAMRRFEDLFSGLPVACFTFDQAGSVQEWNQAAEESFGIAGFDALMRPVWEVFEDTDWTEERCSGVFSGDACTEFDWSYRGREFAGRIIALAGRCGKPVGAVCANVDVTAHRRIERMLTDEKRQLAEANARLHDLASKDGLTNLWNRRALMQEIERGLAEYGRSGKPFSLVLLDIDRFKQYNDSFGHPAGDEVLRRFGRILRRSARSYEQPARYGGEEFALVLHNANEEKSLLAAERFRQAVEDGDWLERLVTCSLGVATVGGDGATADDLISSADAALYASKAGGRNRTTHARDLPRRKAA